MEDRKTDKARMEEVGRERRKDNSKNNGEEERERERFDRIEGNRRKWFQEGSIDI